MEKGMEKDLYKDWRDDPTQGLLQYARALADTGEWDQQPRLWAHLNADKEYRLWASFLWSISYDGAFCWATLDRFPEPPSTAEFDGWYIKNYDRIKFDKDFRYKKPILTATRMFKEYRNRFQRYVTQERFLSKVGAFKDFNKSWNALDGVWNFGRLSKWDYVEALNIMGFTDLDAPDFMLHSAESTRNGVCWACNEQRLTTKKGKTEEGTPLSKEVHRLINRKAEEILKSAIRATPKSNRLRLETAFCWFKKMASRERDSRYFGYDEDKTWEDILYLKKYWPEVDVQPLLDAREDLLPEYLRAEVTPSKFFTGRSKQRMRVYFHTGWMPEVMMHEQNTGIYEIPETKTSSTFVTKSGTPLYKTTKEEVIQL
jgi:hypothetical protein